MGAPTTEEECQREQVDRIRQPQGGLKVCNHFSQNDCVSQGASRLWTAGARIARGKMYKGARWRTSGGGWVHDSAWRVELVVRVGHESQGHHALLKAHRGLSLRLEMQRGFRSAVFHLKGPLDLQVRVIVIGEERLLERAGIRRARGAGGA